MRSPGPAPAFVRMSGPEREMTMAENEARLEINPDWQPPPSGQNVVLFIQASTSSNCPQKVIVKGQGLSGQPVIGESESAMSYGTQYLNYQIALPSSNLPNANWQWTVEVTHSIDEGLNWIPSSVKGSEAVSINNGLMYAVYALCNDDDSVDTDYNDTVVQIVAFNNSRD